MEGHCTVACEDSGFCESRVGDDSFCHVDNVCVARCDSDSDCPSTLTCSGLPDHCHVPGS